MNWTETFSIVKPVNKYKETISELPSRKYDKLQIQQRLFCSTYV